MKKFKTLFTEAARVDRSISALKSHITRSLPKDISVTNSSRGAYHIRFPLNIPESKYAAFFKKMFVKVVEYDASISDKFETKALQTTKTIGSIPKGTVIPWVNNYIGASKSGGQLFNNKDLNPDNLGLAGQTVNTAGIKRIVLPILKSKYDPEVVNDLSSLMDQASTTKNTISVSTNFTTKDLAKVSADFGEILAAIWAMKSLRFKEAFFPVASNEKLIDFYGTRLGIQYPISVKSGGGGKVTVQNIIDAIKRRAKTADADHSSEKALVIFNIVNDNPAKEQMIKLHQYMQTDAIKILGDIIGQPYQNITVDVYKTWAENKSQEELVKALEPFWSHLNMKLTDKVKYGTDIVRLVISPLGESIWKILNKDKDIKSSLVNIARQVSLIQVNVDVTTRSLKFQSNFFRDAEFEFGWAGYAAGNKLGFKMKLIQ
jgi:hypothetical protein